MRISKNSSNLLLIILSILFTQCNLENGPSNFDRYTNEGLQKLRYNNPNLLVDLDAGFKSIPIPMDFDGDGDYDLLIAESGSYVEVGIFYFENISGNVDLPVFRRGMKVSFERRRLGNGSSFEVSVVDGQTHVLTPDRVSDRLLIYKNVPQNVFWDDNEIPLPDSGYDYLHNFKNTQWKMIDFDGDGIEDLVCAAQSFQPRKYKGRVAKLLERNDRFSSKTKQLIYLKKQRKQ